VLTWLVEVLTWLLEVLTWLVEVLCITWLQGFFNTWRLVEVLYIT